MIDTKSPVNRSAGTDAGRIASSESAASDSVASEASGRKAAGSKAAGGKAVKQRGQVTTDQNFQRIFRCEQIVEACIPVMIIDIVSDGQKVLRAIIQKVVLHIGKLRTLNSQCLDDAETFPGSFTGQLQCCFEFPQ